MPWVGFETTIPVFEQAKIFHALDRAAIVLGSFSGFVAEDKSSKFILQTFSSLIMYFLFY
jgi:hypothetical protein